MSNSNIDASLAGGWRLEAGQHRPWIAPCS